MKPFSWRGFVIRGPKSFLEEAKRLACGERILGSVTTRQARTGVCEPRLEEAWGVVTVAWAVFAGSFRLELLLLLDQIDLNSGPLTSKPKRPCDWHDAEEALLSYLSFADTPKQPQETNNLLQILDICKDHVQVPEDKVPLYVARHSRMHTIEENPQQGDPDCGNFTDLNNRPRIFLRLKPQP